MCQLQIIVTMRKMMKEKVSMKKKMMNEKIMRKMMNEKIMRKKKMIMVKMIKKSDSLSQIFSIRSCAGGREQRRREKRLKKVDILPFFFLFNLSLEQVKEGG